MFRRHLRLNCILSRGFSSLALFHMCLNDPLIPGLVSFQVLLNRPLPMIKMHEIYICLQ